ncbi:MAG: hypothetical protein IJX16_03010 [Clostridia bacterium]|nr:hypothetical protein [Clostridia bacterium]
MAKLFHSIWFKCISCLLIILLFSGASIAILSDLLYVSPEERTARAITKIYGEQKEFSVVLDVDQGDNPIENKYGKINKIYTIEGDTLYQAVGYEGYKNGTITLWIQIRGTEITKIIMETFDKQTLMSKLGSSFYDKFLVDVTEAYENGELFTPTDSGAVNYNPVSGATKSANAGCNAVNCVIDFIGKGGIQ